MSIMVNDYFYAKTFRQDSPSWYRLERYDYCETLAESAAAKRGILNRRNGKKRSK